MANQPAQTTFSGDADFSLKALVRPTLQAGHATVYRPTMQTVSYYTLPDMTDKKTRAAVFVQLIDYLDVYNSTEEEVESWIWTLTEMIFPGLAPRLFTDNDNVRARPVKMTIPMVSYLIDGDAEDLTIEENDDGKRIPDFALLPELEFHDDLADKTAWRPIVNAYGIIMFAIGKTPTDDNLTAFNVNRQRAGAAKAGILDAQEYDLTQEDLPHKRTYGLVQGYFNLNVNVRHLIVNEFIGWTLARGSPDQELVATHIRLWTMMGLAHVRMIATFLYNYSWAVKPIRGLASEIDEFRSEYKTFSEDPDTLKVYWKVIHGDKKDVMNSRRFPELHRLAVKMERRKNTKMALYAQKIGESIYAPQVFEAIDKADEGNKTGEEVAQIAAPAAAAHA